MAFFTKESLLTTYAYLYLVMEKHGMLDNGDVGCTDGQALSVSPPSVSKRVAPSSAAVNNKPIASKQGRQGARKQQVQAQGVVTSEASPFSHKLHVAATKLADLKLSGQKKPGGAADIQPKGGNQPILLQLSGLCQDLGRTDVAPRTRKIVPVVRLKPVSAAAAEFEKKFSSHLPKELKDQFDQAWEKRFFSCTCADDVVLKYGEMKEIYRTRGDEFPPPILADAWFWIHENATFLKFIEDSKENRSALIAFLQKKNIKFSDDLKLFAQSSDPFLDWYKDVAIDADKIRYRSKSCDKKKIHEFISAAKTGLAQVAESLGRWVQETEKNCSASANGIGFLVRKNSEGRFTAPYDKDDRAYFDYARLKSMCGDDAFEVTLRNIVEDDKKAEKDFLAKVNIDNDTFDKELKIVLESFEDVAKGEDDVDYDALVRAVADAVWKGSFSKKSGAE